MAEFAGLKFAVTERVGAATIDSTDRIRRIVTACVCVLDSDFAVLKKASSVNVIWHLPATKSTDFSYKESYGQKETH